MSENPRQKAPIEIGANSLTGDVFMFLRKPSLRLGMSPQAALTVALALIDQAAVASDAQTPYLELRTTDNPQAGGREPQHGDTEWKISFPLDGGVDLHVLVGREGMDNLRRIVRMYDEDNDGCRIAPSDIDTSRPFWDAFGSVETEASARLIVLFCQKRGHWRPFTWKEIQEFHKDLTGAPGGFAFNGLTGREGWIQGDTHRFVITSMFIEHCHRRCTVRTVGKG